MRVQGFLFLHVSILFLFHILCLLERFETQDIKTQLQFNRNLF
eukprot:UN3479